MRHPGSCPNDSKLIGQISVWGDEFENSVWSLLVNGMVAGGLLTETAQRDYLNGLYGTSFAKLADVRDYDLQGVSDAFDKNGNGLICAFDSAERAPTTTIRTSITPGSVQATTRSESNGIAPLTAT
ncbi:hypothetical protein BH18ACI5_BH18ACI5_20800 [soil metagenome]